MRECLPWARQGGMVGIQDKAVVFALGNVQVFSWKGVPYPIAVPCSGKTDLCISHLDGVGHQDLLSPGVLGHEFLPWAQTQPHHGPHNRRRCLLLISLWANTWPPIEEAEVLELAEFEGPKRWFYDTGRCSRSCCPECTYVIMDKNKEFLNRGE